MNLVINDLDPSGMLRKYIKYGQDENENSDYKYLNDNPEFKRYDEFSGEALTN